MDERDFADMENEAGAYEEERARAEREESEGTAPEGNSAATPPSGPLPLLVRQLCPDEDDDGYRADDDEDQDCWTCDGDGYVFGDDLDDPLWYDRDTLYHCPNCHGTGRRTDMTYW